MYEVGYINAVHSYDDVEIPIKKHKTEDFKKPGVARAFSFSFSFFR